MKAIAKKMSLLYKKSYAVKKHKRRRCFFLILYLRRLSHPSYTPRSLSVPQCEDFVQALLRREVFVDHAKSNSAKIGEPGCIVNIDEVRLPEVTPGKCERVKR